MLHELVHTIQHDAAGSTPMWLIESIADHLRLLAHLDPPHWRQPGQGRPDRGWEDAYDAGARFLTWLTHEDPAESEAKGSELKSTQGPMRRSEHPPTPTGAGPPPAQATQYPQYNSSEYPEPHRPNGERERRGPFPELVRAMDARMVRERWDDGWWEEMTGVGLEGLWKEYLEYYAK